MVRRLASILVGAIAWLTASSSTSRQLVKGRFFIVGGELAVLLAIIFWIFWEWEPFKGRNFHRLAFQQNHEVGDVRVSILHELEIRVDPASQTVLVRILRPSIFPPQAIFQGIDYEELSDLEKVQADLTRILPRTSVYRMDNCYIFSSTNWRCDVDPGLSLFTDGGRMEMRDGEWIGLRGQIISLRIEALIKHIQCEENICGTWPDSDYDDLMNSFRID